MTALAEQLPLPALPAPPRLRKYQQRLVNELLAYVHRGRDPLMEMPTGAGKSVVLAAVCRDIADAGLETWIFAHRRELIRQLSGHMSDVGIEHGIISPEYPMTDHPVQVCSIDSVRSRMEILKRRMRRVGLIVVDEVHHSIAETYRNVINAMPNARRLGCTATPYRLDGKPLGDLFNEEVRGPSAEALEKAGYLSPVRVIAPPSTVDLSGVSKRLGDFVASQAEKVVNTEEVAIAAIQAYAQHLAGLPTIAYCTTVQHAEDVAHAFTTLAGWSVEVIEGKMSKASRDEAIFGLAEGRHQILFSIDCISEGVDVPIVSGGLMLRPTASTGLYVQQCLDDQTEVLTDRGWLRRENVREDDVCAAFDMQTGAIEWCHVISKMERRLAPDEAMFSISGPHLDIRVTSGHDMVGGSGNVKHWHKETAAEFAKRRSFCRIPVAGTVECPEAPISDADLGFLGWFLSDGSLNKSTRSVSIAQSSAKLGHCQSIRETLDACGFKFGEHRTIRNDAMAGYPDLIRFTVSEGVPRGRDRHKTGWGRLGPWLDKTVPAIYNSLSRRQLLVLLAALNLGDGANMYKPVGWTRRTMTIACGTNEVLADRIQALCVTRGLRCNKSGYLAVSRSGRTWFSLRIKDVSSSTFVAAGVSDGSVSGKKPYKRSRFAECLTTPNEIVWCLENRLGTLLIRRGGKVAIVGNCGRLRRPYPGKTEAVLLDLVGNWSRHGMPNARRPWSLKEGVKGQERAIKAARRCRNCHHVFERGPERCPRCNRKYPLHIERPGALSESELDMAPGIGAITARQLAVMPFGEVVRLARHKADLELIARIRGYERRWVINVLRTSPRLRYGR